MAVRDGFESEEDEDNLISGVGEDFRKRMDALKRACVLELGHGGYISTSAALLSGGAPACGEQAIEEDDEEDDDELLESIQSKYGSLRSVNSGLGKGRPTRDKKLEFSDGDEEDDDEILRSVERLYSGKRIPRVSPPKDTGDTDEAQINENDLQLADPQTAPGTIAIRQTEWGDDVGSPERSSETGCEPTREVGVVASFLPGNWIETDVDLEGSRSPQLDNNLVHACTQFEKAYLPGSVEVVINALSKNRQCQKTLRNVLNQIEARQKANSELQRRVRALVDFEKHCNRRFAGFFTDQANPSVQLIAARAPASQSKSTETSNKLVNDAHACGPPENPDAKVYKQLQQMFSVTAIGRRWSNDERKELAKGVRQQVYAVLVRQAMEAYSLENLDEEHNLDEQMSEISRKQLTAQNIRDAVPGIDWAEVAGLYVVGRTPEECRTRWMNHEDSLINKAPWTRTEDKKLLSIAQQHNFCIWEEIASLLGTDRTPAECLIRYQRSLNVGIMRSNWTPEEDSQLRAAVEEWGESDWGAIAACLEGRNNSQCLMRWYKVLHPTKKKRGRWSLEEDKRLKWAVSVYGPKKWKNITEHVPGRTDLQCRERWCNVLDPSIKLGEWTEEEDKNLEASVAKHGPHRWAAVANDIKIRTDNQCWRRWKLLHPEDQLAFRRTLHIRRTALVGNFQGRRKERPKLGPQDFISRATNLEVGIKEGIRKFKPKAAEVTLDPRECRAARIQIRRVARAAQLDKGRVYRTSAHGGPTSNKQMDAINLMTNDQQGNNTNVNNFCEQENSDRMKILQAGPRTELVGTEKGTSVKSRKRKAGPAVDLVNVNEVDSGKTRKRKARSRADLVNHENEDSGKMKKCKAGPRPKPITTENEDSGKTRKRKAGAIADLSNGEKENSGKTRRRKPGPRADLVICDQQNSGKPKKRNATPIADLVAAEKANSRKVKKYNARPSADLVDCEEENSSRTRKHKAGPEAALVNSEDGNVSNKKRNKAGPRANLVNTEKENSGKMRKCKSGQKAVLASTEGENSGKRRKGKAGPRADLANTEDENSG